MNSKNAFLSAALFFMGLTFVTPGITYAQFRWGFQAGVNFADVSMDNDRVAETNYRIGLIAGLKLEWKMSRYWAMYITPQYVMKGSDVTLNIQDLTGYDVNPVGKYEISYLEFPVGAKLYFVPSGVKPYIFGGVTIATLLKAKVSSDYGEDGHTSEEYSYDISDDMTDTDVLYHIGAGVEFPLSQRTAMTLDLRYSRSATGIFESHSNRSTDEIEGKEYNGYTNDIMLVVGVLF